MRFQIHLSVTAEGYVEVEAPDETAATKKVKGDLRIEFVDRMEMDVSGFPMYVDVRIEDIVPEEPEAQP